MTGASHQLSDRIIACYRGWRNLVQRTSGEEASQLVLIDDLAPPVAAASFGRTEDVQRELEGLLIDAADWKDHPDTLLRYSYAKLSQSLAYANQRSERLVTRKEIEARGTKWTTVPENRLVSLTGEIEEFRRRLMLSGFSENELSDYFDVRLDNADAPALIRDNAEAWLPRLYSCKPSLLRFEFDVVARTSLASWRNRVTHDGKKFVLLVNVAPHVRYTKSLAEAFALHEICGHMVHLQQLACSERVLRTAPHLLCFAIHTQDSYFVEGVAQCVPYVLASRSGGRPSPIEGELKRSELQMLVRHKNITDLIEGRVTPAQAVERHLKFLPESVGVEGMYSRIMADPFSSCQTLNYVTSLDDFRPAMASSPDAAGRIFDALMSGFFAHADLPSLFEACADPS